MIKTAEKHVHKFKRLKYKSGNQIFFCALPDCNQKLNISLALGKKSICWRCGQPFIMNEYSLRLAKPHCEACHKPKFREEEKYIHNYETSPLTLAERLEQVLKAKQNLELEKEDEI